MVPSDNFALRLRTEHARPSFGVKAATEIAAMTSKTLIVALAMLLTATSASLAWTQRTTTSHRGVSNSAVTHHGPYYNSTRLYRRRSNAGPRMNAGRESGFRQ